MPKGVYPVFQSFYAHANHWGVGLPDLRMFEDSIANKPPRKDVLL